MSTTTTVGSTAGSLAVRAMINSYFLGKDSFGVMLSTAGGCVILYIMTKIVMDPKGFKKSFLKTFFTVAKKIPLVDSKIAHEKSKATNSYKEEFVIPGLKFDRIPEEGRSYEEVLAVLRDAQTYDKSRYNAKSMSGCIYLGNDEHTKFTNEAYGMFSVSNPLHATVFPHVRKMETEVINMTASIMRGGPDVCGAMTSGGTESILMAVKAYRDWALETKGITAPELVVPTTVHAAFDKACHYFGIKLIHIPTGPDYKVDIAQVRRTVNRNTIAIVGSAPNYPHGIIDDIQALGQIAIQRKIGLHVDCCLGGYILPFIRQLEEYKNDLPPFDFTVPGVTSMSADTHKYGCAPKGTSVVLFHHHSLRKYMYFTAPDWSGGTYGSPTIAGSRPGGLSVAAWASIVHFGTAGFCKLARGIMQTTRVIVEGIKTIPEVYMLGDPRVMVIALNSKTLNIFQINAAMSQRGWSLASLQAPVGIHFAVTAKHIGQGDKFVEDLKASVTEVIEFPTKYKNSSAAMYGVAASIPDRAIVKDLIIGVLDAMLDAK